MTRWSGVDLSGGFGLDHLPYGVLTDGGGRSFAAVRVGDHAVDLGVLTRDDRLAEVFVEGTLDRLLATGPSTWSAVRELLQTRLADPDRTPAVEADLVPLSEVTEVMPVQVGDYVDFYASEQHATNVGRLFRPDGDALTPNWKHLPIGYHGRAGTLVVSGTAVSRPDGQRRDPDGTIRFGPSTRLDFEAEVGFVLGGRTDMGRSVPLSGSRDHLFGVALLNDWSARDIQAWEYVPLGPFLGKSFATSVAAWITPLAAFEHAWTAPPERDVTLLPYLDDAGIDGGLDIRIDVSVNGTTVSRPWAAGLYWTSAQMLAHLTVNGASIRPGDMFASGTVSGPEDGQWGSLLELTRNGAEPLSLGSARSLGFLEDGDEVVLTATVPTATGRLSLGECRGRIQAGGADVGRLAVG